MLSPVRPSIELAEESSALSNVDDVNSLQPLAQSESVPIVTDVDVFISSVSDQLKNLRYFDLFGNFLKDLKTKDC